MTAAPAKLSDRDRKLLHSWIADARRRAPDREAWALLIADLRWAALEETRGRHDERLPEGLDAVVRSVAAVYSFLTGHKFVTAEGLQIPFARLAAAFIDVAENRRSPLFEPVRKLRGRTPKRSVESAIEAIAALALDALLASGEPDAQAADKVARALRAGKLKGATRVNAKTVEGWRYRLRQGDGATSDAALARYRAPLPPEAGSTPREHARYLLALLRNSPALRFG